MHDHQNPMDDEPAPADDDPATEGQPRRLRVATLLNSAGLLCTTTLIATLDPKIPPFRGD